MGGRTGSRGSGGTAAAAAAEAQRAAAAAAARVQQDQADQVARAETEAAAAKAAAEAAAAAEGSSGGAGDSGGAAQGDDQGEGNGDGGDTGAIKPTVEAAPALDLARIAAAQEPPVLQGAAAGQLSDDEPTVDMHFPRPVVLMLPGHLKLNFPAGVCAVPASLADYGGTGKPHWYLQAHGVTEHTAAKAKTGEK